MIKKIIFGAYCLTFLSNTFATNVDLKDFCTICAYDQSMEDPYILEGKTIRTNKILKEIKNDNFSITSSHDLLRNSWDCKLLNREDEQQLSAHCEYLGSWAGCDIIFYSKPGQGGAHHSTSSIGMYAIKNNQLHTKKVIFSGIDAEDGIRSGPIFDAKGSIYFYAYLSVNTIAKICGISEKVIEKGPTQALNSFWNLSRCEYDIKKDRLKILSVLIDPNMLKDCSDEIKNIVPYSFKKFVKEGEMLYVSGSQLPGFLQKFKRNYLRFVNAS